MSNYTGNLFENDDDTWSGPIVIDGERHNCYLVKHDNRSFLEIRPLTKSGKPSKRVVETLRIQRTNRKTGPIAIIPHPDHPLCIWMGIRDTDSGRCCYNIKPDRLAPPPTHPF